MMIVGGVLGELCQRIAIEFRLPNIRITAAQCAKCHPLSIR